jgi:hypothetical protein
VTWLDRIKHKIDVISDDGELLTPLERSLLLCAANLCDRLDQVEALGTILDGTTDDSRALYWREAMILRRMFTARPPADECGRIIPFRERDAA